MAGLFNILKVTVSEDKICAHVLVNPGMPLMTSEDIEATARVYYLVPAIAKHLCLGDSGREFQDCMGQTELCHLLEHVTVEFMNLTVSVMGEVAHPGQYSIDKDNVTVLDALSMAGDLTIYGKREKVLVLRQENGKQRIYGINLCSGEHIYSSPVYYLQQGDVVYVEPNSVRARQSTVNGNNIRSTSFWVSIASLLTSVCILIFN